MFSGAALLVVTHLVSEVDLVRDPCGKASLEQHVAHVVPVDDFDKEERVQFSATEHNQLREPVRAGFTRLDVGVEPFPLAEKRKLHHV